MKVARYIGNGEIAIVDEPTPACPPGGLLVRTEASGLCSGELMAWYMDKKIPHVLGHEVCGTVIESNTPAFPLGSRVFPHHHAPCLACDDCGAGRFVHCDQWRRTKLTPGGMAEYFAVAADNLNDTIDIGDMRSIDAGLIEPLACVVKSLRMAGLAGQPRIAVIGLGVMGLMHALLRPTCIGYDLRERRRDWAESVGVDARHPDDAEPADVVFVCPGSQTAFDFAYRIAAPAATIVLFAPLPPGEALSVPQAAYFRDLKIAHSYSCGPNDTQEAFAVLKEGRLKAEQVVSDFIALEHLPRAYQRMKSTEILKPMVVFGDM